MRALSLLTALAMVLALGTACGSLDSADQVHDLRLLGLRADPPEQVFSLAGGPDGGASTGIAPITLTALVADPLGAGRAIPYAFETCAELDDDTGRCETTSPGFTALAKGDFHPPSTWGELSVTFTPSLALLEQAQKADAYQGFGGLPLPVQLTLGEGDEQVVGYKRVIFTVALDPSAPPPPANENPVLSGVTIQGHLWGEDERVLLSQRADYEIAPLFDPALEAPYAKPTFQGGSLAFTEDWRFNFFATAGTFSPLGTGGSSNVSREASPTSSTWTPRDDDGPQDFTCFVVVRDGRGGESWLVRKAHFAP